MPSEIQHVELDIPIEVIWDFIRDDNNWAPLVPGYIQHEKLNDRQIIWEFCGDIPLTLADLKGRSELHRTADLLPKPFDAKFLEGEPH